MNGSEFDNLARRIPRRGLLAIFGAVGALALQSTKASQVGPPSCGQSGDVCTMLIGCCNGFTCVTSAINVNYGVCVSGGSGGTVSTGTGLISPFSEDIEQEIAAMASDPALTATGTTDVQTPEERRAEIKARKDAHQSRKSSRRTTRRNKIDSRRTTRNTENDAEEEADRIAAGPLIEGELFNIGSATNPETLKVTNRDIGNVTLTRIESRLEPDISGSFTEANNPTLAVGESYNFFSNEELFQVSEELDLGTEFAWTNGPVCNGTPGAGFRVYVSFSSDSPNREYEFLCDTPFTAAPLDEAALPENANRRKKKKQKQRARQRQSAKNRKSKNGKR